MQTNARVAAYIRSPSLRVERRPNETRREMAFGTKGGAERTKRDGRATLQECQCRSWQSVEDQPRRYSIYYTVPPYHIDQAKYPNLKEPGKIQLYIL